MSAIVEPFFICLLTSMIWAPIVFLIAGQLQQKEPPAFADKIWPAALLIAALPALMAPVAAAFGLSLRAQGAPEPPMAVLPAADVAPVIAQAPAPAAAVPAMDIAALLEASAALYVYGFLLFLVLGAVRLAGFSYRVRYAVDLDEPRLRAGLDAWRRRMGLRQAPRYAFSDAVSSVCVHGFFRPVILMPMYLLDRVSIDDAVLMGAHEMAHIKRGDTWLFAFTRIVKAIFWFNPFIHRISARAHLAAEQAADALVIARGVNRRHYAKCFVEGLRFSAGLRPNEQALVPSFTPFDKRSRRERLDAILSGAGGAAMISLKGKIGLALSVVAASGLAFAQAAFAVAPKPPEEALPEIPVEGEITFGYGAEDVKLGAYRRTHQGVDIKAARGTPVRAAGDGKVIDATRRYKGSKAWGNVVVIDHGHGLITRYAHLDSYAVKKGDIVKAGDTIGAVGSSGVVSGPHLHFEVIRDGVHIDPTPLVAAKPMPAPKPLPEIKSARAAIIAPKTAIAPTPAASVEPSVGERLAEKLKNRFNHLDDQFADLTADLDGLTVRIDNEFNGFEGFTVALDDMDVQTFIEAQELALNALDQVRDIEYLSEEDQEKIREAKRAALEKAREAERRAERVERRAEETVERAERYRELTEEEIERIEEEVQRAREWAEEEAERAMERAEELAERARERAEEEAERQREHAERQRERAERERERAMERAERDRERAEAAREEYAHRYSYAYDDEDHGGAEEHLEAHAEALRKAKAQIEREIAEIERQRAELKRKEKDKDKSGK